MNNWTEQKITCDLDKTREMMTRNLNKMVILAIEVKSNCFLINFKK